MQRLEGHIVYSASDLVAFLACEHVTGLALLALSSGPRAQDKGNGTAEAIQARGEAHEAKYLACLRASGLSVIEVKVAGHTSEELRKAEAETLAAMRLGCDVVYQATFFDGTFRGHADFLLRVESPSALGVYSYEVADTKLSRSIKAGALLQLCAYSEQLERLQGLAPKRMHVITGDLTSHPFPLANFSAYYRTAKARLQAALRSPELATYPEPVEHCSFCRHADACHQQWKKDDHLSLVAGLRKDQAKKLRELGIRTVAALGESSEGLTVAGIGAPSLQRIRQQAKLQLQQRVDGLVRYEVLKDFEPDRGLCLLPEPCEGDIYFDMEGDPLEGEAGLEYLFGAITREGDDEGFKTFWAHSPAEEKKAFEAFMDFVADRRAQHPALHIYHYAPYEPSALKRLAARHQTRTDALDDLLRARVLVDLYQVVRQAIRVSQDSYSIKALEPLYMGKREGEVKDAASSIVAYESWLNTRDPKILEDIKSYNKVDCVSTWKLRGWLEARRNEEGRTSFGADLPRPSPGGEASEDAREQSKKTFALYHALLAKVPEDEAARDASQQAQWLLAQLLDWHRREDRPEWWAFFERCQMTDEQLLEDSEALGGLTYVDERLDKRSVIRRYTFNPGQEYKILVGTGVINPATGKSAGTVLSLRHHQGELELRGNAKLPRVRAVIPSGPLDNAVHRAAVERLAQRVSTQGMGGGGAHGAARELLLRSRPNVTGGPSVGPLLRSGEDLLAGCCRLAVGLNDGCLPIQGPPGSGKTYTGARMILALIDAGKRVGITANSHKAIQNLVAAVYEAAQGRAKLPRTLQKCDPELQFAHPSVETTSDNDVVVNRAASFDIVTGTSWLWSRLELEGAVDVLFVDEAGQMSLANAVAVAGAASGLILLGDPQQLAQPSKGSHPPGAELSALEFLLEGRATIPAERGVLLHTSYRMHPDVCSFISEIAYEGLLVSDVTCRNQFIESSEPLFSGTGLRFVPVVHSGNRAYALEEVTKVGEILAKLLGAKWTSKSGETRVLLLGDILIVSPYNAHVSRLKEGLPAGARIGTVDKFQGQEAPVSIYSMATSSAEEVPRTMEFLFELNRFNVAVSRAQGLSIVLCSPDLLRTACKTPRQMRLVNALCRFAEVSQAQGASSD